MKSLMKKFFLFFFFVLSISLHAQENRASFGVRGGFGYSNITNPGYFHSRYSYKTNAQVGIFSEVKLAGRFFLQAELLVSNPGTRLYQINSAGYKTSDSIFSFNCLQLPIEVKVKTNGDKIKGYYMTGVAPSYLINANLKYKVDSNATFYQYTPYENRLTANLVNTAGIEVDIGRQFTPFIDFRYMQGLTNVHKIRVARLQTNLQFLLCVGVRF
ncbi:MAG TPA: porin family protein [Cytophagaceae bacterium]|nr:porin family protein [Cytophagaceae bacterium]